MQHDTLKPDIITAGDDYRQRFSGEVGRFFLETQARGVAGLLGENRGRRLAVLEVGGGHGQLTPILLDWGWQVCVQGSAPCCAGQVRPLMRRSAERLCFVASDLWSMPFADGSFDLVVAIRLLSHVRRWEALLSEMARVTRGLLLFDYAAATGLNALTPVLFGLKKRIEGNTRPYFCYTKRRLVRHLRRLGFDRISIHKQFALPMGLHRLMRHCRWSGGLETACRRLGLTALIGSPVLLLARRGDAGVFGGRAVGSHAMAPS